MTVKRPFIAIFIGTLFVLLPSVRIDAGIDRRATSTIPVAGIETDTLPIDALKNGLDALSARDIDAARAIRDELPFQSLDRHVLAWAIALYGGNKVPSSEISATAAMLPDWPGIADLRMNGERALARENPAPTTVIETLGGSPPLTLEGTVLLARAYRELGNTEAMQSVLSPLWRTEKLDAKDEFRLMFEFGAVIRPADHRYRMERMFYADQINSALRVAPLADAMELASAWAAVSRDDKAAPALLDAVPAAQRSAGFYFASAEYWRKRKNYAKAAAAIMQAPTDRADLVDPDAWWVERRVLSRGLMDQGDAKTAYAIASAHAAMSAASAADAEFHAGWYALRGLNDAKAAAQHFARIATLSQGPISLSRAYYWLGRAAEAGGPGDAKDYFAKAATYGTTFYGQLAGERIGHKTLALSDPEPTAMDRERFSGREAVAAIGRLESAGYARYATSLYRDLAGQLTSPGEVALLAQMALNQGSDYLALRIAKIAATNGVDIGALSHPVGAIPETAELSGSGRALAYAIARQESEFNVGAVSGAGALGLLQLMPDTAEQQAKKAGLPFSQMRLTTDAGYNATLGAAFLGEQLGRFNGSYVLTFAGYNAGPRRATQWMQRYGDPRGKDIDTVVDWIERIPYTETRSYVQRVMENYEVYKMRLTGSYDIAGDLVNGRSN